MAGQLEAVYRDWGKPERAAELNRQRSADKTNVEFVKAAELFSQAIKLQPGSWEAWNGRAFAYFHLQQWDNAAADFSKAIELAPEVHTNWLHRGHAYLHLAQWDKAAADFSKLVEQWPQDSGGWFFLAAAHAQLNQPNEALSDLRQAIANGFNDIEHLKNVFAARPDSLTRPTLKSWWPSWREKRSNDKVSAIALLNLTEFHHLTECRPSKKAAGEAYRQASSSPARHLSRRSVCAHTGDDFLIVLQIARHTKERRIP